ncbi:MAG: biotin/lipoyl-binding protein [Firmicutes bacterium]|nr:biotin/lipoyl-binding protein [Bacillota bacterium]
MKKYKVNVNGTQYEIEIELMGETEAAAAPKAATPVATAPKAAAGDGEKVSCPMPGTIFDIKVKTGDTVKKGQVLMILEAMKMENEIMAACDGTVTSITVTKGASVQSGDLLCTIK